MVNHRRTTGFFGPNEHEGDMREHPTFSPSHGHVLLVASAPMEAAAVGAAFERAGPGADWERMDMAPGWSLVRSGVGKVNAGVCVARCLGADGKLGTLVLNVGVCGALPRAGGVMLANGTVVVGSASVYADEGVQTPTEYQDMGAMGFAYWPGASAGRAAGGGCAAIEADGELVERARCVLAGAIGEGVVVGRIATVSTCSGTDALAGEIARRTGGIAEAMEGAAIGHTLARLRGAQRGFLEVRVVSNTTGDRGTQVWDLRGALAMLTRATAALRGAPE